MHDDTDKRLTPELIVFAIQTGLMDESLVAIKAALEARIELVEMRAAANLNLNDRFLVKDCRPKKWNGVEVRFTGREGIWLVCEVFHEYDRSALKARVIRLRTGHVGTVTHRAGE